MGDEMSDKQRQAMAKAECREAAKELSEREIMDSLNVLKLYSADDVRSRGKVSKKV